MRVPVDAAQSEQVWFSSPFLDIFVDRDTDRKLVEQSIQLDVAGRPLAGYLVRPTAEGRMPAVLVAPGPEGLSESFRQFTREIAGIGYATLAVDYRPDRRADASELLRAIIDTPNDLAIAVDWLAAQPSVDPERIGAIGWDERLYWIAQLAETGRVKAAVVTGNRVCADSEPLFRVHDVPILIVAHSGERACGSLPARFRSANLPHTIRLDAAPGIADLAWVEIYELLAKYVEDAPATESLAPPNADIARIVDIMRAINSDDGVRGRLARSLAAPPANDGQWEQARSEAAIVAEAGNLLLAQRPPKGSVTGWRRRATDFRTAARATLRAIEVRDYAAAQESFRVLPRTCSACHAEYR
jgi:dienelactone hydrolase